jgi:hypothetical protein
MSGSEQPWGGRADKTATNTTEVSKDAELQTKKGPSNAPAVSQEENPGSDPV